MEVIDKDGGWQVQDKEILQVEDEGQMEAEYNMEEEELWILCHICCHWYHAMCKI